MLPKDFPQFKLPYYDLRTLVGMIDEPNRSACQRAISDHETLFKQAAGSSHNHQAWAGGYWDHITEAMNICVIQTWVLGLTGRLPQLEPHEQFSLSDTLLVVFWHDIEKPWGFVLEDGKPVIDEQGRLKQLPHLATKAARREFAEAKIKEYGVVLTPIQRNGLDYVEGIRDADYSPSDRRMWPAAVVCHISDLVSARFFYDFPKPHSDAWSGARRATE